MCLEKPSAASSRRRGGISQAEEADDSSEQGHEPEEATATMLYRAAGVTLGIKRRVQGPRSDSLCGPCTLWISRWVRSTTSGTRFSLVVRLAARAAQLADEACWATLDQRVNIPRMRSRRSFAFGVLCTRVSS